jgi:hypothetical protein
MERVERAVIHFSDAHGFLEKINDILKCWNNLNNCKNYKIVTKKK